MQSRAERGKEQMRELCKKFFNSIGAQCHDDGALLRVSLPASVTSHFDADELDLVFEPTDLMDHPNAELFAPGSRIFDLTLKWLREHARLTAIEMPVRYDKHPSAIALTFHGCRIVEQRRRKAHLRGILCSFKASYMPMNKPATVHHVLVFENGFVRDMHIPVDELLINGSSTRRRLSKRSLQQLFNRARLHVERLIALEAEQAQDEFDSDARYEMQRIVNYYDQLLGEMALRVRNHQQFAAEFESIQRERDDKLSEELERHRVRVVVQLIGIVEIHLPVVENLFRIASRDAQADVRSYFDLFEGRAIHPICNACEHPTEHIHLCANGHITCAKCASICNQCHRALCYDCGIQHCVVCNAPLCVECQITCSSCNSSVCQTHCVRCASCDRPICEACKRICAGCGQPFCSAHVATCSVCGKAYCHECMDAGALVRCSNCGADVCAEHIVKCAYCSVRVCNQCGTSCTICGAPLCGQHQFIAECCSEPVCIEHITFCEFCNAPTCENHAERCVGCGRVTCPKCHIQCTLCERAYCPACMKDDGWCTLCTQLIKSDERTLPPRMIPHPLPTDINPRTPCRLVRGAHISLYLWRYRMGALLIIADRHGNTIDFKQLSALWALRHLSD